MDYIKEFPNNISETLCEDIIKRFEEDPRRKNTPLGEMLTIGRFREWKDVTTQLDEKFKENMYIYMADWASAHKGRALMWKNQWNMGYDVFKTTGIPFTYDEGQVGHLNRLASCRWDLTPGPDTNFFSKTVKAEKGKYTIWPASWSVCHEDTPSQTPRYIIMTSIFQNALDPRQ
jgi:hypothetical protein